MDYPFRSAVVGGFNKQDVLKFLEEQARQAAQTQQEIQSRLDEAERQRETYRQERDSLTQELDEARRELDIAHQAGADAEARLNQTLDDLSTSRKQAEQLAREVERLRQERDEARLELDEVRPDAQAYLELKERTAGVELDAHRRAHAIQEKAEREAQKARCQVEQWLQRMAREYDFLCSQVETTVSHAASELEKAGVRLDQLNELMSGHADALDGVRKAYGETDPDRVEAPMPIDEESGLTHE